MEDKEDLLKKIGIRKRNFDKAFELIECRRCENGERLKCSYPCAAYIMTGHQHNCPDCGRENNVAPAKISDPEHNPPTSSD
jgi:hypothetical protein